MEEMLTGKASIVESGDGALDLFDTRAEAADARRPVFL